MTAVETEGGDKIITHRQNYSGSAVSRILVKNSPKAKNQTFIYISLLLQIFDLFVSKRRSSHIKIKHAGFIFISDNS